MIKIKSPNGPSGLEKPRKYCIKIKPVFFPPQVSWIRRSDLKILTIGETLYTKDKRFAPLHEQGSSVWILKLTHPEPEDSGEYECQVSYHDDVEKKLTMPFALTVLGK